MRSVVLLTQRALLFLVLLLAPSLMAAELDDYYAAQKRSKARKKAYPQEVSSKPDTYEPPKIGAAFDLGYHFIGPGIGAESWYRIDRRLQAGGRFLYTKSHLKSGDLFPGGFKETADVNLTTLTGQVRYFVVGSFYLNAGLNVDNGNGTFGYEGTATKQIADYKISATHFHGGIGNQWVSPTNSVFGIDWFGFGQMLSQSISVNASDELKTSTQFLTDQDPNVRLKTLVNDNFRYYFFMVYVGTSF